ncbi:phage protein NinX family protein [Burkholderia ambifaria]|uniref:phage protein NinX family protein n=1 Tax=Burkholderia ambifaria TaxID=152480 RepID=UPI001FC86EE1
MLDYWVARAEGADDERATRDAMNYRPSSIWSQGGPIIDREQISLKQFEDGGAYAYFVHRDETASGTTALIAAMRVYVQAKIGEEVPGE